MSIESCVQFTGVQNESCKAGVKYADVRVEVEPTAGRGKYRFPCFQEGGECACAVFLTPEQEKQSRDRYVAKINETFDHISTVLKRITETHGKYVKRKSPDVQGVMDCPKCGAKLGYSRSAYNGHVWGRCSTAGCLSWME